MRFPLALTGLSRYIGAVGSLGRRVALILPAALIVWTARVPRPVGYLLGLGGVAYLVTGWIFGGRRFRAGGRSTQFHPAGSSGCRRCLHADHRLANADVRGQASWRSHQSAGGAYVIGMFSTGTGIAGIAGAVMQVVAYCVFIFIAGAPATPRPPSRGSYTAKTLQSRPRSCSSFWPSRSGLSSSPGCVR